ncbi:hypothetical protein [Halorussus ruber]|uniref:hypothetical protein n=1 Tax=Halorussus ruber TaxID=1126238 RepID=UPI0010923053|nr:hypothetical protein [Halorussus ruber]
MSDRKVVIFETSGVDAEEELIREYVVPAFRRLEDSDDVKWLTFARYGHDPSVEDGEVTFYIYGDPEAVAEDERDRWDELVADGFAEEWWTDDTEVRIDDLDESKRLHVRLWATASRMAVAFFEEFDEVPDAVAEVERDGEFGVGWRVGLHHLINDLSYQEGDGEEEIDLLFELVRSRLFALSTALDPDWSVEKADELVERLESLPPELREFREKHGKHQHSYADREAFEEG